MASASQSKVVPLHAKYPKSDSERRPFRIWISAGRLSGHAVEHVRRYLAHRYYKEPIRAHRAAWLEAGWAHAGTVLEVVDARTGRLLGQYRTHADNRVSF